MPPKIVRESREKAKKKMVPWGLLLMASQWHPYRVWRTSSAVGVWSIRLLSLVAPLASGLWLKRSATVKASQWRGRVMINCIAYIDMDYCV